MRNRLAAAVAAIGVAFLGMGIVAPGAHAATLDSYDVGGAAQSIVNTVTIRPSIFDPLAQGGAAYAEATLTSQGGGNSASIAAQVFPGKFGIGALGCSGAPAGLWHQAQYPTAGVCKDHDEGALASKENVPSSAANPVAQTLFDHMAFTTGNMVADAKLLESHAIVRTQSFALTPDPATPPAISTGVMTVTADTKRTDTLATHDVRSVMHDLSILNDLLTVGSMVSHASTTTDGVTGVATATLTIEDVKAFINGDYHNATIDNRGVRIDDPALSRDENLGLTETFNDELARAGITITAGKPVELAQAAAAEASVGGLLIALHGSIPSMKVPSEIAPYVAEVVKQIPTKCFTDFGAKKLPLCFGPGVVPGFGSEVVYSMVIGAAQSHAAGFPGFVSPPVGTCATCGPAAGPFTPPFGGGTGQEPFVPPGGPTPGSVVAPTQPPTYGGPLVGLVARLPAAALVWAGAALLVLAVGVALAPSLRDARAR